MRMNDKDLIEINRISERALGYGAPLCKDDVKLAVKHVRWLQLIGEGSGLLTGMASTSGGFACWASSCLR